MEQSTASKSKRLKGFIASTPLEIPVSQLDSMIGISPWKPWNEDKHYLHKVTIPKVDEPIPSTWNSV